MFSYQFRTLGREYPFASFVKKKALRLLNPCYVFGIFYYAMFYCGETIDVKDYILTVLNGAGHLWFLPMLFLCFISVWMLNRFRPNSLMTFCLFSVLSLVPARCCISFMSCPLFPLLALCLCRLSALVVQRCETVIYLCDSGIVCFNGLLL